MILAQAYPDVRRQLEQWRGCETLLGALRTFEDLHIYVAGGVIRNVLMGTAIPSKDFDFFLMGESVASAINYFDSYGLLQTTPYGAPRWYPKSELQKYADLIPIADFVPGLWQCENIVDVLAQFDFTANAVAYDLRTGEAFDPQNGARDATRHVMKMIRFDYPEGPYIPGAVLNRNVVLWFRIIHYASTLDLAIEPLTRDWLLARSDYLKYSSEFARLFFIPDLRALKEMHD
jgi:hypothetical protein